MPLLTSSVGQPIGDPVPGWTPRPPPPRAPMHGRPCALVPLAPAAHAAALFEAHALDREGRDRTCLPYGPFASAAEHLRSVAWAAAQEDPQVLAVVDAASGRAVGTASSPRVDPAMGRSRSGTSRSRPRSSGVPPRRRRWPW